MPIGSSSSLIFSPCTLCSDCASPCDRATSPSRSSGVPFRECYNA
jgi:hypothetical protein